MNHVNTKGKKALERFAGVDQAAVSVTRYDQYRDFAELSSAEEDLRVFRI